MTQCITFVLKIKDAMTICSHPKLFLVFQIHTKSFLIFNSQISSANINRQPELTFNGDELRKKSDLFRNKTSS